MMGYGRRGGARWRIPRSRPARASSPSSMPRCTPCSPRPGSRGWSRTASPASRPCGRRSRAASSTSIRGSSCSPTRSRTRPGDDELVQTARAVVAMANAGAHVFVASTDATRTARLTELVGQAAAAQNVDAAGLRYHWLPVDRGGRAVLDVMRGVLAPEVAFPEEYPAAVDGALSGEPAAEAAPAGLPVAEPVVVERALRSRSRSRSRSSRSPRPSSRPPSRRRSESPAVPPGTVRRCRPSAEPQPRRLLPAASTRRQRHSSCCSAPSAPARSPSRSRPARAGRASRRHPSCWPDPSPAPLPMRADRCRYASSTSTPVTARWRRSSASSCPPR